MDKKNKKTHERRTRILNEAEKLFAKHGFDGVTMRQIATKSAVDVALASYHFKNKRGLFDAVLWRRSEVLNGLRHVALDKLQETYGDESPPIDELIDSWVQPMLDPEFELDEGWRHYYELIAMVNSSHEWGKEIMTEHFDPLLQRYLTAFKKALPYADEADIYYCYHFLSGSLTLTIAQTGRMDNYSGGLCSSQDMATIYKKMVPFFSAGFKAVCQQIKSKGK